MPVLISAAGAGATLISGAGSGVVSGAAVTGAGGGVWGCTIGVGDTRGCMGVAVNDGAVPDEDVPLLKVGVGDIAENGWYCLAACMDCIAPMARLEAFLSSMPVAITVI